MAVELRAEIVATFPDEIIRLPPLGIFPQQVATQLEKWLQDAVVTCLTQEFDIPLDRLELKVQIAVGKTPQ